MASRADKQEIIELIREIDRLVHKKHHDLAKNYDLTYDQFHLLLHLDYKKECPTIGQLAARWNKAQNTISEKITRLEEKGLIKRIKDTNDRRVSRVEMTDTGRNLINSISHQARNEFVFNALGKIEKEKVQNLYIGLKELTEKLVLE